MRQEAAIAKCPEQIVDAFGIFRKGCTNKYALTTIDSLLGESTGMTQVRVWRCVGNDVEIDCGHEKKVTRY
jgi:hypothetical protein